MHALERDEADGGSGDGGLGDAGGQVSDLVVVSSRFCRGLEVIEK